MDFWQQVDKYADEREILIVVQRILAAQLSR
jgi:hypothetical protein